MKIDASPTSLKENLQFLSMALPIALAIGIAQLFFSNQEPWWHAAFLSLHATTITHLAWGAIVGLALILTGWLLAVVTRAPDATWAFKGLAAIRPSRRAIWLLSAFAAFFEEILYRAALVPILGIFFSAALFSATHAGMLLFAPSKRAGATVALDIFIFGIAMGLVFEQAGLAACMVAHLVHNLVAFRMGQNAWETNCEEWQSSQKENIGSLKQATVDDHDGM